MSLEFTPPKQKAMIDRDVAFILSIFEQSSNSYTLFKGDFINKLEKELYYFLRNRDRLIAGDLLRDIESIPPSSTVLDPMGTNAMISRSHVLNAIQANLYV